METKKGRKCASCRLGTIKSAERKKIVVPFDNPGAVVFEGTVEECDKCGLQFIAADDIETAAAFEKAFNEQYAKHHAVCKA